MPLVNNLQSECCYECHQNKNLLVISISYDNHYISTDEYIGCCTCNNLCFNVITLWYEVAHICTHLRLNFLNSKIQSQYFLIRNTSEWDRKREELWIKNMSLFVVERFCQLIQIKSILLSYQSFFFFYNLKYIEIYNPILVKGLKHFQFFIFGS